MIYGQRLLKMMEKECPERAYGTGYTEDPFWAKFGNMADDLARMMSSPPFHKRPPSGSMRPITTLNVGNENHKDIPYAELERIRADRDEFMAAHGFGPGELIIAAPNADEYCVLAYKDKSTVWQLYWVYQREGNQLTMEPKVLVMGPPPRGSKEPTETRIDFDTYLKAQRNGPLPQKAEIMVPISTTYAARLGEHLHFDTLDQLKADRDEVMANHFGYPPGFFLPLNAEEPDIRVLMYEGQEDGADWTCKAVPGGFRLSVHVIAVHQPVPPSIITLEEFLDCLAQRGLQPRGTFAVLSTAGECPITRLVTYPLTMKPPTTGA
jgi:hypothetical protein